MRPVFTWNLGTRSLELGRRTLVMGIVNVTPDSFSDGGEHFSTEAAVAHALKLLDEGSDLVDIGGESTRPGSKAGGENPLVTLEEELRRVMPVLSAVKQQRPSAIVSVDTYKAKVAQAAVAAGAQIINDVSGFQWDPEMAPALAGLDCGAVLMHTRGRPEEWRSLPAVPDMVMLVKRELRRRADAAVLAGIKRDRLLLDPGFGFGKGYEGDYALLRRFSEFAELRFPLTAGVSRKSFVGHALETANDKPAGSERLFGSLGAEIALALKGVHIIRTHEVRACAQALRLADLAAV